MYFKGIPASLMRSHSMRAIGFIFLFLVIISSWVGLWKQNRIIIDGPSYYTYLPAFFIHHDLSLKFIDKDPAFYSDKIWYNTIENEERLIKHPPGLALALSPFFVIGHITAGWLGISQDGYSLPYQNAMTVGVWVYLFAGLLFLRRILLDFFSELTVAITIITLVIGTNLFWYSTFECFMPHAVSFSLLCICLYVFHKWLTTSVKKYLLIFSLCFALIVLIRPLAITILVYFLITGIGNKKGTRGFLLFLRQQLSGVLLSALIFTVVVSLQFLYWKYATGKWIYDVYINEHFIFDRPMIFSFLFSFRKGIFIYTPLLSLSVIGLVVFYKKNRTIFYSTTALLIITIYLLSSWWAWSYGISWGIRPMIDYYSFLSLPLAAGINYLFSKKMLTVFSLALIPLFVLLNLFQTWQYKNALIHYDDMSREAYFKGFLQTKATVEWADLLKPYNWERRKKGLPQIEYSREMIENINADEKIFLRGINMKYFSASTQSEYILTCNFDEVTEEEIFYIQRLGEGFVAIKNTKGKYFSVKPNEHNIIVADANTIGDTEKFILTIADKNDNRIYLQTPDKKYLSIGDRFPFIIIAGKSDPELTEKFRLFLFEDYRQRGK